MYFAGRQNITLKSQQKTPRSLIEPITCQERGLKKHCQHINVGFGPIMYINANHNVHSEKHFTM